MNSINTLIDLPLCVCEHIISYISDTYTYKSLRISCTFFYYLMHTIKTYYPFSNNIHKIINFKNGITHGQYITLYDNSKIFKQFNYHYGYKQGICKIYYRSGKLKNSCNYKFGYKNGVDITYFLNGGISQITNYKGNCKYKREISNNIDGSLNYIINYETPTKYELTKFLTKKKLIAAFENNNVNGEIVIVDDHNNIQQVSDFVDGYLHGSLKTFKNKSVESLINYYNGRRNGLAYFWNNENIQKMCNYKNNMLNGVLKYWSDDLLIEAIYEENKLQTGIYTSKNSTIKLDFADNKPHDYYIEYQYDDIVRARIRFSYGNFDKIYKKYYYTGNLQYEYFYNNESEFMVTHYDMNGRIKYKLIKNNRTYTIYHKYASESLVYYF